MIPASTAQALVSADQLLEELQGPPAARTHAPTMGRLKRCSYTHDALIDLIIEHPEFTQNEIAAHFGYTAPWISNILASEAFQSKMALRREEIIDPDLKATIKERFEALVIRSLAVLQEKLAAPQVSDQVAIRCAELGAKALGVGGHAPPPKQESSADRLERLAARLIVLNGAAKGATYDGTTGELLDREGGGVSPAGEGLRPIQGPGSGEHVAG